MQTLGTKPSRTLILVIIASLALVCLCICLIAALSIRYFGLDDALLTPLSSTDSPQNSTVEMDKIQLQVARLRGLSPTNQVTRALINSDQLRQNVTNDFLSDYSAEEAETDALVLSAFGLLEPDFPLLDFYLELYSEQIAGYYDHETKEMFVVQDSGFNGPERLTYAHEFTHVLQDQVYDIQNGLGMNEEDCEDDSERCLGIQALLEGDASLLELQWFEEYATAKDRSQVMNYVNSTQSPVFDSAPPFMKEDFVFPYNQGYAFVEYLYGQGGWEAVDQAYALPPVSSEQILHPALYPQEIPQEVSLKDIAALLGADWTEIEQGVIGEWYTFLILAHGFEPGGRVETQTAQAAAAGWGGDAYAVYQHREDQSLVMASITVWDSETDAQEFEQAFSTYLRGRFGQELAGVWIHPDGRHNFVRLGNRTIWLAAPDAETAEPLWDWLISP